jgi:hypothetical protein
VIGIALTSYLTRVSLHLISQPFSPEYTSVSRHYQLLSTTLLASAVMLPFARMIRTAPTTGDDRRYLIFDALYDCQYRLLFHRWMQRSNTYEVRTASSRILHFGIKRRSPLDWSQNVPASEKYIAGTQHSHHRLDFSALSFCLTADTVILICNTTVSIIPGTITFTFISSSYWFLSIDSRYLINSLLHKHTDLYFNTYTFVLDAPECSSQYSFLI